MRLIVAWTGVALFNAGVIAAVLLTLGFFTGVRRGDIGAAGRVAEVQSLLVFAAAASVFGAGLSAVSLDSPPLVPLGVGLIALSIAIGTYGARLHRLRR